MSVHELVNLLPDIETVCSQSKAMAMLDSILHRNGTWRHFSFDSHWAPGESLASMNDGNGNDYAIVFLEAGAYAQACNSDSPISAYVNSPPAPWPGLFDSVPVAFGRYINHPEFSDRYGLPRATVCLWRESEDPAWSCGDICVPDEDEDDADGAEWLFSLLLEGTAEAYQQFTQEVYDFTPALGPVQEIYNFKPLTHEIVAALNGKLRLEDLAEDCAKIGYPIAL